MTHQDVEELVDKYPEHPIAVLVSLRTIRPHPGIMLEDGELNRSSGKSPVQQMADCQTQGIDVLLVTLRHLLSLGLTITPPNSVPQSTAERKIMKVAKSDLGFVREEDWMLKRAFYDILDTTRTNPSATTWDFAALVDHDSLPNIFNDNMHFRLFSSEKVFTQLSDSDDWVQEKMPVTSNTSRQINKITCYGHRSLAETIWTRFQPKTQGGKTWQFTSERPRFLRIRYEVTTTGQQISELRSIQLRAPEVFLSGGLWDKGTQYATYQLCVVIKLAGKAASEDKVRIYGKDGLEIEPSEVGDYEAKELITTEPPWSVTDRGTYNLFYFRVDPAPFNWPQESELKKDAPEFTKRRWMERVDVD
jgi:hypothetical protein